MTGEIIELCGGSWRVQLIRADDGKWFWREKWHNTPPSIWRGPFDSRSAAETDAGINPP